MTVSDSRFSRVVVIAALVVSAASTASAQVAKFTKINDAVPGKFFDASKTAPGENNPNKLIIGFETGLDVGTLTTRDFSVTTVAFGNRAAADTISFVVKAPAGFYVSKLTYVQRGTASQARTAVQFGSAQWTVAGFPALLGLFNGNPDLTGVADLTSLKRASVPVSITLSLFAGATGSMAINGAHVVAELSPLPVPQP